MSCQIIVFSHIKLTRHQGWIWPRYATSHLGFWGQKLSGCLSSPRGPTFTTLEILQRCTKCTRIHNCLSLRLCERPGWISNREFSCGSWPVRALCSAVLQPYWCSERWFWLILQSHNHIELCFLAFDANLFLKAFKSHFLNQIRATGFNVNMLFSARVGNTSHERFQYLLPGSYHWFDVGRALLEAVTCQSYCIWIRVTRK